MFRRDEAPAVVPPSVETFESTRCAHCGGAHLRACPRVRRMVFSGGQLAEVEFFTDGDWDDSHVQWPEEIYAAAEEVSG